MEKVTFFDKFSHLHTRIIAQRSTARKIS